MTDSISEHFKTIENRVDRWLSKLTPADRIEALADLRGAITSLVALERAIRRDTLNELVNMSGLDAVAESLGVTPERLLRVIAPST